MYFQTIRVTWSYYAMLFNLCVNVKIDPVDVLLLCLWSSRQSMEVKMCSRWDLNRRYWQRCHVTLLSFLLRDEMILIRRIFVRFPRFHLLEITTDLRAKEIRWKQLNCHQRKIFRQMTVGLSWMLKWRGWTQRARYLDDGASDLLANSVAWPCDIHWILLIFCHSLAPAQCHYTRHDFHWVTKLLLPFPPFVFQV